MPEKFNAHRYQLTAISFLLRNDRSGLFLDPGLGKTAISLSTINILKNIDGIKAALIIAPLRVIHNVWPGEFDKWENFSGLKYTILHGKGRNALWHDGDRASDVYLINPEGLKWLHGELLKGLGNGKECPFNALWVDESTKFKSSKSERFKLLCDMLPLFKRRHIMTGTPSPKSLLDLWSQVYLLDDGKSLGEDFYRFRASNFKADDYNNFNWVANSNTANRIKECIGPIVLEMSADKYLDMPELLFNTIRVPLPQVAEAKYKTMEQEFFLTIDESTEVTAGAAAQASLKCHQVANGSLYEDIPEGLTDIQLKKFKRNRRTFHIHNAKIEALCELVSELNGKPLLVAYHYRHDLAALRKVFGEHTPNIGRGAVSQRDAKGIMELSLNEIVRQWNKGSIPILLGHPASMAHGLNLQAGGNDVCWFSLTWSLEDYLQFNARVYRQGVGKSVRVHHLVSENTIDEAMLYRLGKRATQQQDLREALSVYRHKKGLSQESAKDL